MNKLTLTIVLVLGAYLGFAQNQKSSAENERYVYFLFDGNKYNLEELKANHFGFGYGVEHNQRYNFLFDLSYGKGENELLDANAAQISDGRVNAAIQYNTNRDFATRLLFHVGPSLGIIDYETDSTEQEDIEGFYWGFDAGVGFQYSPKNPNLFGQINFNIGANSKEAFHSALGGRVGFYF